MECTELSVKIIKSAVKINKNPKKYKKAKKNKLLSTKFEKEIIFFFFYK